MSAPTDFEMQLRELLNARADELRPSIDTGEELRKLRARFPRERRRGVVTLVAAAAAAVAVVAGLGVGIVDLTRNGGGRDIVAAPAPDLPPAAAQMTPTAIPAAGVTGHEANNFTDPSPDLAINGVLWVNDQHEGRVERLDASSMRVLSNVYYAPELLNEGTVGKLTRYGNIVLLPIVSPPAFGPTVIARFDAASGERLGGIVVATAGAIVTTPVGVFATVGPDRVGLLDVARARIVRTFAMPVDRSLAYVDGLLWGWDIRHSLLVGVDPARGVRVREFSLPGYSDRSLTALGEQTLLIDTLNGTALLNVATGEASAYTHAEAVNYTRDSIGSLWGVVDGNALVELDPVTLRTLRSYSVKHVDLLLADGDRLFASVPSSGAVRAYDLKALRTGR